MVYLDFFDDIGHVSDARERLVSLTSDLIADACVQGFIRYAEKPAIPKKKEVIESWQANSIPYTHTLLSLSVFQRLKAGLTVSMEALPHCIAAVVTSFHCGDNVPDYEKTLTGWFLNEAHINTAAVISVLSEIWAASARFKRGDLPGFYQLSQDPGSRQLLGSLSADVLRTGIDEDKEIVVKLVSILLKYDPQSLPPIGATELARNELSTEVRTIWRTVPFHN